MKKNTENITAKDGKELKFYSWLPDQKINAAIGIIHGLGEHSNRYNDFAKYFCDKGFGIYSIDLRGHGLSEGKRGHINNFNTLLDDSEEMFIQIRKRNLNIPMVMFGHSLGGCIALNYLCQKKSKEIELAIISSPWLKTVIEPPKFLLLIQKLLNKIFPSLTLNNRLNPKDLSKDTSIVENYIKDPLVHSRISIKMFSEVNKSIRKIETESKHIDIPILLIHGKKDKIISYKGTENVAKKIKYSNLKLLKKVFHEPHNDYDKNQILKYYFNFINKILKFKS